MTSNISLFVFKTRGLSYFYLNFVDLAICIISHSQYYSQPTYEREMNNNFRRINCNLNCHWYLSIVDYSPTMSHSRGSNCVVSGCKKRRKNKESESAGRSDSEGTDDDETEIKRMFPRTFHKWVILLFS